MTALRQTIGNDRYPLSARLRPFKTALAWPSSVPDLDGRGHPCQTLQPVPAVVVGREQAF